MQISEAVSECCWSLGAADFLELFISLLGDVIKWAHCTVGCICDLDKVISWQRAAEESNFSYQTQMFWKEVPFPQKEGTPFISLLND